MMDLQGETNIDETRKLQVWNAMEIIHLLIYFSLVLHILGQICFVFSTQASRYMYRTSNPV